MKNEQRPEQVITDNDVSVEETHDATTGFILEELLKSSDDMLTDNLEQIFSKAEIIMLVEYTKSNNPDIGITLFISRILSLVLRYSGETDTHVLNIIQAMVTNNGMEVLLNSYVKEVIPFLNEYQIKR